MDQTDIAFYGGVVGAPVGAILFEKATGLTAWLSFPIGAVCGFVVSVIGVFALIELLGRVSDKKKKQTHSRKDH